MKSNRRAFLGQLSASAATLAMWPILSECTTNEEMLKLLPTGVPEAEGVHSQAIIDFINAANSSGLEWHSFMLLKRGKVLAETYWKPFDKGMKHALYSLSKSFTSTAIGFAVQEKLLTVEDPVISFFEKEYKGTPDENLKAMKVKHLLTMTTGHDSDTLGEMRKNVGENWVKSFINHPVVHEPGTHFLYNTGATYVLGAILEKVSGQLITEYLKPRLFDPLEITDYDWELSPDGLNTGGYGLRLSTESIAKFGQFYLQKGKWNEKQLLNQEWIETATSKQTDSQAGDGDWSQGYGYQFWRCKPGFYRGDGAFGQYCIVMPDQESIIAVNSETFDMGKSMQLMWDHLLPGMTDSPLEANEEKYKQLLKICSEQELPVPKGNGSSSNSEKYSGKRYKLDSNPFNINSLMFNFETNGCQFITNEGKDAIELKYGSKKWEVNPAKTLNPFPVTKRANTGVPSLIASSGTWIDDNNFQLSNKFIEGIHTDKIIFTFDEEKLTVKFNLSSAEYGSWGPDERAEINGSV
ncbi:CubicO group peptidase, beta-lactamase class C family [Spirosomataceae bacterium TFI 002]|nr:CubicO group peptidase, beta-lactamase class C family [Spirosomataceae bacterium TFI 002]